MKVGFPRPRDTQFGLPVPFTAMSVNMVGAGDDTRIDTCITDGLCSVCGLPLDRKCFVAVSQTGSTYKGCVSRFDPGLTHDKCAQMARAFCPHFRDGGATLELVDTESILELLRSGHDMILISAVKR